MADFQHNPFTKSGRKKFCRERHIEHKQREAQYHLDIKNQVYKNLPNTKIFVQCKNCKGGFVAKKANRKRGWAKFCSKSCKAQF